MQKCMTVWLGQRLFFGSGRHKCRKNEQIWEGEREREREREREKC